MIEFMQNVLIAYSERMIADRVNNTLSVTATNRERVGRVTTHRHHSTSLLDDHRALEPPDPIPNSAVKRGIADGSVGSPHVRVGHRQALKYGKPLVSNGS